MGDIIAGRRPVMEALRSGRPVLRLVVALEADSAVKGALETAKRQGVLIERIPRKELDRILGGVTHQGIAAEVDRKGYVEPGDIVRIATRRGEKPLLVLLDGVQDPQNLGAILRTAEAAGAHGLIFPKRRSASLSLGAIKASAGASEHMAVSRVVNLVRTMESLKGQGIWLIGAAPEAPMSLWEADLTGPIGLVLGGEGEGLGRLVKESCDLLVSIPMKGRVASLNVSVSAAILLYEIMRQRGK